MMKNKTQNSSQGSNKNKGKKPNGNIRPFSYTAFKNYGASNKTKRKKNQNNHKQTFYYFTVEHIIIKYINIFLNFV